MWIPVSLAFAVTAIGGIASGQSFNVDFGPTGGTHGIPAPTYGAAGPPGVWQAADQQVTANLIDADGIPTGVTLSFQSNLMPEDCTLPSTQGGDDALLDDTE